MKTKIQKSNHKPLAKRKAGVDKLIDKMSLIRIFLHNASFNIFRCRVIQCISQLFSLVCKNLKILFKKLLVHFVRLRQGDQMADRPGDGVRIADQAAVATGFTAQNPRDVTGNARLFG